jgi:hypothetical protein
MKSYADTSFLGSLYIASDAKNGDALAIAQTWRTPPLLPFTPFALFEFRNMLARLQYKGILRPSEALQVEGFLRQDLKNGTLEEKPLYAYQWIGAALAVADNITPLTGYAHSTPPTSPSPSSLAPPGSFLSTKTSAAPRRKPVSCSSPTRRSRNQANQTNQPRMDVNNREYSPDALFHSRLFASIRG